MKPLSVLYYSLKNRRKVISMAISIGFSVALIYSLQFLVDEVLHCSDLTSLNPLSHYSEVRASSDKGITKEVIDSVIHDENTERVIPVSRQQTFYISAAGGKYDVGLFSLSQENMRFFIDRLKLKVVNGRLPKDGTNEIAMDYRLAKNKGLKIGDKIGYSVNKKELDITGAHTIVGLLSGDSMEMVMPLQSETENGMEMLIFHKEGKLQQSNTFLGNLPKKIVNVNTHQIFSLSIEKNSKDLKKYMSILVVMLIIVLSISTGNSSYINIYQRRYEFGLLNSVGYSPLYILKKASTEICFMNMVGYCLGIILALIFAGIQYFFLFEPNGLVLRLMQPSAILQTLAIPAFTTLFSVIPVSWMLKKIDPISIIEGVE